ncbi:MAG: ATP synthase subunit delta [Alphaproteobacteria bacterium MarineAlpha9_Bin4]|nr:ATP synthase F1 subunit delta [Pelagibacterales bacterium]PPR24939.1 MAG: ATP synthase subunit delta [Alphaproteobacteria bacterium MarineAlpha9_Bin4]|tara:strand:+ start:499 stop:1065 length:567 start_codon:yes stop_codon:yes gene_type:complete
MLQNTQFDHRAVVKYSSAYYGIIANNNQMFEEIKQLLKTFLSNKNFDVVFKSPLLNKKQQTSLVLSLFAEKGSKKILVSKNLFGLMMLLAKNSRLQILESVLNRCIELQNSNNKEIKINVTSVSRLNDDLIGQLKKIFSKNSKKNVKVVNLIDQDLLGGLIVQIGSNLIDTSVKTKLNKIKSAMKGAN